MHYYKYVVHGVNWISKLIEIGMIKSNYAKQHYCSFFLFFFFFFFFLEIPTIPNTLPAQQKPTITERADTQWRSGCNTLFSNISSRALSKTFEHRNFVARYQRETNHNYCCESCVPGNYGRKLTILVETFIYTLNYIYLVRDKNDLRTLQFFDFFYLKSSSTGLYHSNTFVLLLVAIVYLLTLSKTKVSVNIFILLFYICPP